MANFGFFETSFSNKNSLDKNSQAQATCLSQVSEPEQRRVQWKKRPPTRLTDYQVSELKKRFKSDQYIKGIEKELLAKNLGITQTTVKDWFYWERLRRKRKLAKEASNATVVPA